MDVSMQPVTEQVLRHVGIVDGELRDDDSTEKCEQLNPVVVGVQVVVAQYVIKSVQVIYLYRVQSDAHKLVTEARKQYVNGNSRDVNTDREYNLYKAQMEGEMAYVAKETSVVLSGEL